MGRVNTPILSQEQRQALEVGLKTGLSHCYRMRCQSILLKADGRPSKEVGLIVGMSHVSVNSWLNRYQVEGIGGLKTKPGRGRKASLRKEQEEASILEAVKANRQRLQTAQAEWESARGKSVSRDTFRRFLKGLVDVTNG